MSNSRNDFRTALLCGAVASLLAMLALVTLAVKSLLEWRYADEISAIHRH